MALLSNEIQTISNTAVAVIDSGMEKFNKKKKKKKSALYPQFREHGSLQFATNIDLIVKKQTNCVVCDKEYYTWWLVVPKVVAQ